jgi:hypothetical protein
MAKNRYASFAVGDSDQLAVRVTFLTMPPGFEYAQGRLMWVQEPYLVGEPSGSAAEDPEGDSFWAATLGCDPYYTDWTTYGTVDLFDDAIIPDATFALQSITEACDTANPDGYSVALDVDMSTIGDVTGDCAMCPCTAADGRVDFIDISAVVEKFKNTPCEEDGQGVPRKARADIINATLSLPVPDQKVDFVDISCVVEAFRGTPCEMPGPPAEDPCGPSGVAFRVWQSVAFRSCLQGPARP